MFHSGQGDQTVASSSVISCMGPQVQSGILGSWLEKAAVGSHAGSGRLIVGHGQ